MARAKKKKDIVIGADGSGVQLIDTSKEAKKTLEGLAKTALRESGKLLRKQLRADIPLRSKRLKNHIASWARIDNKTGQPILEIGFYSRQKVQKRGKKPSHANPHWIELGTSSHIIGDGAKSHGRSAKLKILSNSLLMYDKSSNTSYGKTVDHPGTRATHVLKNTVQENIDEIRKTQAEFLSYLNQTLEAAGTKIVETEEAEDD